MATEEEVTDILWEEMKTYAKEQQQYMYECLSDCTIYKSDEYKYLKQNIGYSIYGPPKSTKSTDATESNSCYIVNNKLEDLMTQTVADTVGYEEKEEEIINKIYKKICECAVETDGLIYFGVIYNMIFRPKTTVKPKKKKAKTENDATKNAKSDETKNTENDEKNIENDENKLVVSSVPLFTIRKDIKKKTNTTKSVKQEAIEIEYETWYIDLSARVYKNWKDYIETNTLPECTMVLPKDGIYQPNTEYPNTEDFSSVLLEIMESPACTWKAKLCKGLDIASNVVGFGTIGLSVAALFTPLAPVVVVSSLAAAGATGAWSLGRNIQQLVDRTSHEESIHVLDTEALPHYIGIAGTAFGLGVLGGSAIISKVAERGMTVHTFARAAFNTVQGGNLIINGIGIIYQGYNMYDKYQTDKTVSIVDALNLATHLMFFCGSVVKVQFASDIIESTQGKVMSDYKESLSNKRLRKKFNRAMRKAAANNPCKMSENAEVIRYIRHRQDLLPDQSLIKGSKQISNNTPTTVWSYEHGKLKVCGILLLDPIEYVTRLIRLGIFISTDMKQERSSSSQSYADDPITGQLLNVVCDLLSTFYTSDDCPRSSNLPIPSDFEPLIREMRFMNINEDYLRKVFYISVKLMKRSRNMDDFFYQIVIFVWQYCKANLEPWGMSLCHYAQSVCSNKVLKKIITAIFEAIKMIANNLSSALLTYIDASLHKQCEF